ncbi:Gfo/Idh/MocA family oxidoreductase [uncultured Roseibium sp.]|uniref:Gfo/Idh/MocA family protein n=1 Tax=uncultured Roseibium sp. TaxID=1936171 RepID=UPI002629E5C6|nr:Gfo/Idh/MocA family oxidoreductase [uncultured Roseibium sp.]
MIRVAIIGAGIGRAHLEGYRALPERYSVKVMCDLDIERATDVVAGTNVQVEADLSRVMADPEIDLVDVCLPPHLHYPVVMQALEAGKHVVCEKPLVTSLKEADELVAAARKANRRLTPVFQYRFGPGMAKLKALIDAGLAGKPYAASLETHWDRDEAYYAVPWRGTWDGENGGAVLGHAIHNHDLLTTVMGAPARVNASVATRVNDIEVEDCAAISFQMVNGSVATSSITLGASTNTSRIRFCFEGLTAESGSEPYAPAEGEWTFVARAPITQSEVDDVLSRVQDGLSGFAGFFEALADALEKGGTLAVSAEDGRQSIELVSAIYQAARENRSISLPLTADNELYSGWKPKQLT